MNTRNQAKNLFTFFKADGRANTTTRSYGFISLSPRAIKLLFPLISEPRVESAIKYLNRLSDYLYVYARYLAMVNDVPDDFWYQ